MLVWCNCIVSTIHNYNYVQRERRTPRFVSYNLSDYKCMCRFNRENKIRYIYSFELTLEFSCWKVSSFSYFEANRTIQSKIINNFWQKKRSCSIEERITWFPSVPNQLSFIYEVNSTCYLLLIAYGQKCQQEKPRWKKNATSTRSRNVFY